MNFNLIEVLDDNNIQEADLSKALDQMEAAKHHSNVSIAVVGVGGGGCNAVANIHASGLTGVRYVAVNTDTQSLNKNPAQTRVQLGADGQGAGAIPAVAQKYAEEKSDEFKSIFKGTDMVFITAGLGKGTGTGATAVIAKAAKAAGALTVGVVTKPFDFEGPINKRIADQTADMLADEVDALITVMNSQLEKIYPDALMDEWYKSADEVLINAVGTIVEVIHTSGYQNVDFKDVMNVMGSNRGRAMMGTARASGENRAQKAAYQAMNSQLLEENSISSARGVLVNITAARSKFRGRETAEVMNTIRGACAEDVNPIMGLTFREDMGDDIQVTLIVSGLGSRDRVVAVNPTSATAELVKVPEVEVFGRTGTHDAIGNTQAFQAPQAYSNVGNIPTLTQTVDFNPTATPFKQADALKAADTVTLLYQELHPAHPPLSQAEQLAAEVASFTPKMVPRAEPSLMVKPAFGHINRLDSTKPAKIGGDVNPLDLDVPTFLRRPLAD